MFCPRSFNYCINVLNKFKHVGKSCRFLSSSGSGINSDSTSKISLENSSFINYLHRRIEMKGPLTVADYMKEALGNPKWVRYY